MGFEPTVPLQVHTLSKRTPSATRTPFHIPTLIITVVKIYILMVAVSETNSHNMYNACHHNKSSYTYARPSKEVRDW